MVRAQQRSRSTMTSERMIMSTLMFICQPPRAGQHPLWHPPRPARARERRGGKQGADAQKRTRRRGREGGQSGAETCCWLRSISATLVCAPLPAPSPSAPHSPPLAPTPHLPLTRSRAQHTLRPSPPPPHLALPCTRAPCPALHLLATSSLTLHHCTAAGTATESATQYSRVRASSREATLSVSSALVVSFTACHRPHSCHCRASLMLTHTHMTHIRSIRAAQVSTRPTAHV